MENKATEKNQLDLTSLQSKQVKITDKLDRPKLLFN